MTDPKIIGEGAESAEELEEDYDPEIWDDENYAEDEREEHFTSQLYQVMY